MLSLQDENDELRETLAQKTLLNENLRSDLHTLQSKFDTLTIAKQNLEERLEEVNEEVQNLRNQPGAAQQPSPGSLEEEVKRLKRSLDSKTRDFDYLTAVYQDASATASESAMEVVQLKKEVEELKRRIEIDVRAVTWEGEKKALMEKVKSLESKCKLLAETIERLQRKEGTFTEESKT